MNTPFLDTARNILEKVVYSTLATAATDGSPWAAPMFTVYDPAEKEFYWCAARNSQHAKNIRDGGKVFIVVYDSMAPPGEGDGVYIRGVATEVTDPKEVAVKHAMIVAKHKVPYWSLEDLQPPAPIALYKASVKQAWVNHGREDNGHFVIYRQSIEL